MIEWERLRADNPGPFTLSGTNTWVLGRDPAWIVDPGPALGAHLDAIARAVAARGGAGGIAITHDHPDHVDGVPGLLERLGGAVPVAAARYEGADVRLADGDAFGPLRVVATPGHAPDHLAFAAGAIGCSGDAVLGEGSVFVAPGPRAMAGYLDALERLLALELDVVLPGHGPPVTDPRAKLEEYLAHRRDRERRLLEALAAGARSEAELLDAVWDDVPPALRGAAAVTLAAHLGKLEEEGRLPGGVERRDFGPG
ncbi:MAG: MBL-fold metallo-hydrolase superfamily [uncultured Solirubrobacteraceae bacterium]|uniref:MBL-fold metallo-hydrolase superfamily n=1 Tax=uncultured Solirubrobacteraceae bacterium TaxID=1162706 RepID=A0A6J4TWZ8_9ACTN|nr:MAG: MBL-fold metallo-hydrolase superfamily [uncultured Solirubrobacteraceae bacterium]